MPDEPLFECRITRTEDAKDLPLPGYMTPGAAGMDLRANVGGIVTLKPGGHAFVPTGVRIALPEGLEAQVRPRSGLARDFGVTLLNAPGTIDADYRGEICVMLINHGEADFFIERGMRVAQMVISQVEKPRFTEISCPDFEKLPRTERGAGGFGHTGV